MTLSYVNKCCNNINGIRSGVVGIEMGRTIALNGWLRMISFWR